MVLKFESIYKAVFENRLVSYFLRFIPSLQELVMLGKILFHVEERLPTGEPKYQRVVVDAPATGHAISFFNIDRKSTRLNSSHPSISYAVFCLKKKKKNK